MSADAYEDHIRFLGYHVPLDTTKLPPTAVDALVRELNESVPADEGYTEEDLEGAANEERGAIVARFERELDQAGSTAATEGFVSGAAKGCARLVADNIKTLAAEDPAALAEMLVRWFENDLRTYFVAAAEDAADARVKAVRDLIEELDT